MKRPRSVLLIAAVVLAIVATVIAVSGGVRTTVGGFRVSMRSPGPAAIATLIVLATWWQLARRQRSVAADLEAGWSSIERHATRLIGIVALISALVAASFATRSAAGADASGYLSEADAWFGVFPPVHIETLAEDVKELDGWISTPLGWRPGTESPLCDVSCQGLQVPTYPPGLPMLMALPHAMAGIDGANAIVIGSAALAVWATGMITGGAAGILAALLLALSPAFLYQSVQPMSDVPVTAAWMLTFLLLVRGKADWIAGLACGIAVLIRPNLAPLALVPLLVARQRVKFAIPVAIAGLYLAFVHSVWYGSPLQSGYGSAGELFALSNVMPNASRYAGWLLTTAPVLLLAPIGFARVSSEAHVRALAGFSALVIASYLIYAVFDHWSYLRFLLPALAVFAILASVELAAWIRRSPAPARLAVFLALTLGITAYGLAVSRSRDTFKLADQLRRVEQAADFANQHVAPGAVIVSGEQSGSMRYYTGRPILRWEAATPEAMAAALVALERAGRPVYIVLDAWENAPFQQKFFSVPEVRLDWPPMLEAGTTHRTKVWRISDRARFLEGTQPPTVRLP